MSYKANNMTDIQTQIAEFRAIAKKNYDKDMGWQTYVECYDDTDIRRFIESLEDGEDLETAMRENAEITQDRWENAQNERYYY